MNPFIVNSAASIDSFKIRIPLKDVEIINPSLEYTWVKLNTGTDEILEEGTSRLYRYTDEDKPGISIKYNIEKQVTSDQSVETYLTIGISSKILETRYQEGINSSTVEDVYNNLMLQRQVYFPFDVFLKGVCTDVDIKKDFKATTEGIRQTFRLLKNNCKKHSELNRGVRLYNSKMNFGIQFNDRNTTAIKEAPYLKIYAKGKELHSRSFEFTSSYLSGCDIGGVYRVEATIKNKKHFRSFDIKDTSLLNLLSVSENKLNDILSSILKSNLQGQHLTAKRRTRKMSSSTQFEFGVIVRLLELGDSIEDVLYHSTRYVEDKEKRKYQRRKLRELYKYILEDEEGGKFDPERREQILQEIEDFERVITDVLGL